MGQCLYRGDFASWKHVVCRNVGCNIAASIAQLQSSRTLPQST